MKVLVTGGTGTVGSRVVKELLKRGAQVRVLARKQPEPGKLPAEAEIASGDLMDPVAFEKALEGVDKLFLLNANVPDELTQALIAYGIAKRKGIQHITYLSIFKTDQFKDVPHFALKVAVENVLRESGMRYTILRPGYFMQNDGALRDALMGAGIYPVPIGVEGICSVDVRDIAEAAAISLTSEGHDGETYDLVGPTLITGPGNASLWSRLLGRQIQYAGHDFDQWELQMRSMLPAWKAFEFRTMFQGYFERGFASTASQAARVTKLLGHAPRSYESFAEEMAAQWKGKA